jgi:hypothetical protein
MRKRMLREWDAEDNLDVVSAVKRRGKVVEEGDHGRLPPAHGRQARHHIQLGGLHPGGAVPPHLRRLNPRP